MRSNCAPTTSTARSQSSGCGKAPPPLNRLSTLDYARKHRMTLEKRHPNTNNWLFDPAQTTFSRFEQDKASACFCCYGTVGTGKTVLASSVIARFMDNGNVGTSLTVYHYFDYLEPDSLSQVTFYGSLLRQMVETVRSEEIYAKVEQLLGQSTKSPNELAEAFLTWSKTECDKLFLVLDGLDELTRRDQQSVIKFVQTVLILIEPRCKVFLTCRSGEFAEEVLKHIAKSRSLQISHVAILRGSYMPRWINGSLKRTWL